MGIKCLLISINQVKVPYPVYPLGIAHIAGALHKNGHAVLHFDLLAMGGTAELNTKIKEFNPDLIGVSIRNLDTVDSSNPDYFVPGAVKVMELIRKYSSVPVVIGGPAFSILPDELFALMKPDYGIAGEGERLICQLASHIETNTLPPPQIFSSATTTQWCPVSYNQNIVDYYLAKGGMLNIQTKRGCPYRCGYCSYPVIEGSKLRLRDPEEVASEVNKAVNEFGAKYIFFTDSVFNDHLGHHLKVCEELIKNKNKTPWTAYFRPGNISRESLKIMKQAGLAAMELGTDAATDITLEGLKKDFTFKEVIEANELATELEIPHANFVIFGGPCETEETVVQGIKNLEQLPFSVIFAYAGIRILPDTNICKLALEEKIITPDNTLVKPVFYYSPDIKLERLDHLLKQAWTGRIDRIYPSSDILQKQMDFLFSKGYVGPLWDKLVRSSPRK
jgi:lipid biosynthesis B12-binding/radical SAM protein